MCNFLLLTPAEPFVDNISGRRMGIDALDVTFGCLPDDHAGRGRTHHSRRGEDDPSPREAQASQYSRNVVLLAQGESGFQIEHVSFEKLLKWI